MSITGNVQVDKRYLEGPRNVVLERDTPLEKFCDWAQAAELSDLTWLDIRLESKATISQAKVTVSTCYNN